MTRMTMKKIMAAAPSTVPSFLQIFTGPRQTMPLWESRATILESDHFIEMALCRLTWTLGQDVTFRSEAEQRVLLHPLPPEDVFTVESATHIGLGALMKSLSGNFEGAVTRLENGLRIGPNWDPFHLQNILVHLIRYRFEPTHTAEFQSSILTSLDRIQWKKWSDNITAEDIRIDGLLFLGNTGNRKATTLAYDLGSKRLTGNRTDHLSYLYLSEAARQLTLNQEAFTLACQGIEIFPNDLRLHRVLMRTAFQASDPRITLKARQHLQDALGEHRMNQELHSMSRMMTEIIPPSSATPQQAIVLKGDGIFGIRIPRSRQKPAPPQGT